MKVNFPKGFLEASDGHAQPQQGQPLAWHNLCRRARELGIPVVYAGDGLDLIIWGWERYFGSPATCDFMKSVDGLECYYVVGNHEGKAKWVRRLFHAYPNIHVVQSLNVNVNGIKWHIEHGDRLSLDWGPLGGLYRGMAYAMLSVAPRLWFRMMKRWRPGKMKPPLGTESEKYTRLTGIIWRRAMTDAIRRKANIIIGHTHSAERREERGFVMLDSGDLRDGSSVYVDPHGVGSIKWFGSMK